MAKKKSKKNKKCKDCECGDDFNHWNGQKTGYEDPLKGIHTTNLQKLKVLPSG